MKRLALALAIVGTARLADAGPDKGAGQTSFAAGKELYAKGDYLGAAKKFEDAYSKDPDPAYIFNAGQAFRRSAQQKAGSVQLDCARSAKAYKEFLRLVPKSPNRTEVEAYATEMARCAGSTKVPDDKPPVDKPPIDKPPIDKPPIDKPPIDKPPNANSPLEIVGLVVGGVGLVGLGAGGYFALHALDLARQHDSTSDAAEATRLDKEGHTANVREVTSFVIGGAVLATGVVLYVVGRRSSREQRLTIAPTRGGATLLVRF